MPTQRHHAEELHLGSKRWAKPAKPTRYRFSLAIKLARPGGAMRSFTSSLQLAIFASSLWVLGETSPARAQDAPPGGALANDELIYSVNRTPESPFETSRAVQVITQEQIWRRNARTLPEVLFEETGIFVQQTNYGAGSPIIRGQMGKQILILIDGVRVNNATYRFGPVQYLNTVDLAMVERIEVVRGVGSVMGGDAFGGSINIITKKGPGPGDEYRFGATLFSRYSTADQAVTGRAEVYGRSQKFRYLAGVTYRDSADVEAGGDRGKQRATGYGEEAGNVSFEVFLSPERTLSLGYQFLEQQDVPRTDRIVDRTNTVFDFDPQRLQLLTLSLQDVTDRSWSDVLRLTASWNRQDEGRREIRSNRLTTERQFTDQQTVKAVNLEVGAFIGARHRLVYGADYSTEDIVSRRRDLRLDTGVVTRQRGNYTDGASYEALGVYIQDRFNIGKRFTVALGARYNDFAAAGSEVSSVGTLKLDSSFDDVSSSLSLLFQAAPNLHLIASARRGFRAPNLDDLSVFDERAEGTEVPNVSIGPEHAVAYEIGAKYQSARLSGSVYYHRSSLSDLLVRSAGVFNGLPFFDRNGNGLRDPSEPLVLQKQNIGEATIDGIELDFRIALNSAWLVFANATETTGDDELLNQPLTRIPPRFGTLGLRWSPSSVKRRPWAELVGSFAEAQRRLAPADITDSRIGVGGTDAFATLHLRGGMSLGERLRLTAAAENLTDEEYKLHSSGVFRPGRQLVLGVQFTR
jgi:hemoglobin/transferrin/lactoferrin receptor protein